MSGRWLDDPNGLRDRVARVALDYVGEYELPPGSNRSTLIDAWNTACGAPMASSWCMTYALGMWREAGATVPAGYNGACETVHQLAAKAGLFVSVPQVGDIALYDFGTTAGMADHAGIVVRVTPALLVVEGNTSDRGGREGVGVFMHDRSTAGGLLLGFVSLGP